MSAANFLRSRQVLEALGQGIDPENGSDLPADTILNRVDVVRALLAAIAALDAVNARALRRAQLPGSVGKTWGDAEERQLKEEFAAAEPLTHIATKHGRTVRAIEARLERLRLLRPDQRTTQSALLSDSGVRED